jgi:hypothetical protein
MFFGSSFTEESVEGIVSAIDSLIARNLAIRSNVMFEAVELPTSISDLDSSLANVQIQSNQILI